MKKLVCMLRGHNDVSNHTIGDRYLTIIVKTECRRCGRRLPLNTIIYDHEPTFREVARAFRETREDH